MLRLRLVLLVWYWHKRYGSKDSARAFMYRLAAKRLELFLRDSSNLRDSVRWLAGNFENVAGNTDYWERGMGKLDVISRSRLMARLNAAKDIAATLRGF